MSSVPTARTGSRRTASASSTRRPEAPTGDRAKRRARHDGGPYAFPERRLRGYADAVQGRRATAGAAVALVLVAAAPAAGGPARPHPGARRVLATGDSMIQYVDVALARRLRSHRIKVPSDAHVGTGLSKPFLLDWVRHSRKEAAR